MEHVHTHPIFKKCGPKIFPNGEWASIAREPHAPPFDWTLGSVLSSEIPLISVQIRFGLDIFGLDGDNRALVP